MSAPEDKAQHHVANQEAAPGSASATVAPTEADVKAFLHANPDFLDRQPDLLERLLPPGQAVKNGVADFQWFMVDRLQRRIGVLQSANEELIDRAAGNLGAQAQVHAAVIAMLDARNFEHLIDYVTTRLAGTLGLDVAAICIEARENELAASPPVDGIRVLRRGRIAHYLDGEDEDITHLLCRDAPASPEIFGSDARHVRSSALVRLNISRAAPPALLALGSHTPGLFDPEQAADLLTFLAQAMERCIRGWLDLPPA